MVPADFLLLLRRRLALILILTTAGLSFAIYSTSKITPMYAATATIFVSTPPSFTDPTQSGGNKLGDLATGNNFTQARVKSYATIINLNSALDRNCDMGPSDYHPTLRGQQKIAAFMSNAIGYFVCHRLLPLTSW